MGKPLIEQDSMVLKWRQILKLGEQLLFTDREENNQIISSKHALIENLASQLFEAQVTLWLVDRLTEIPGNAESRASPIGETIGLDIPQLTPLMRRSLTMRRICCSKNSEFDMEFALSESLENGEVFTIAAPLISQEYITSLPQILGVIQVEKNADAAFSLEEIELFKGFVSQTTLGLHALQQMETERWRLDQLSLVREVSTEIAHLHDLDQLSLRVTELILNTFRYYYAAVFTLEKDLENLQFRASAGPLQPSQKSSAVSPNSINSPVVNARIGHGIIGNVARSGVEIIANDVRQESRFLFDECLPETRSEAAIPLKVHNRLVGVLDVQSKQPGDFLETDMLILRTLASNIAIAIENARIYSKLQYRASQLSIVAEVGQAITSILDPDKLIAEVSDLIQKRFGYPFVHLFSINPVRKKIEFVAGSGGISQKLQEIKLTYNLDDPQGIIPWVARSGESRLVNDLRLEPLYRPVILLTNEARSELCVPLKFADRVLGVLDIQSNDVNAFSDDDRQLFETLADNIGLAMRNAQLFRSEQWRMKAADSLREVAGLLSEDVDLHVVLNAILVELDRTLPSDLAAIWLLNKEKGIVPVDGVHDLTLAAVHSTSKDVHALKIDASPQEIILADHKLTQRLDPTEVTSWFIEAMNSSEPILRSADSPYEPLGAALGFEPFYSAIAAPLRVGERNLGVLTLIHHDSGRYGDESQLFTAAYASYAAVAIENTSLYESAFEQAWISSVLLRVSGAIQSLNNINELLNSVIEFTLLLAGVKAAALYLLDHEGTYTPCVSAGLSSEAQFQFMRWRFAAGDVPVLDKLRNEPNSIILDQDQDDQVLINIFRETNHPNASSVQDIYALIPFSLHKATLGVMLIHYNKEASKAAPGVTQEEFYDRTLPILEGIADQTAVAIENIRLLESQKDEAYVTGALLQVARAVAGSNDLNEALTAVADLIPNLVGAERAVFFLWENAGQKFHLCGGYGISQSESETSFNTGDFRLLDAVLSIKNIIAIPLAAGGEREEHPVEDWAKLPEREQLSKTKLLQSNNRLLVAFPLMIKEQFVGTLLVEELDFPHPENPVSLSALHSARERRVEIITGITQQISLAIQNDQLERETIEREKLEREMQLAREIQQTFLPQFLPAPPGWDIEIRWRTARQVGGDFYDIFELPGERLGFIVADVADKGMPAALWMTMIRTLLHSTLRETDSPTEVLAYLNHVLVPDTRSGMFVTMLYGVLNTKTGEFFYANAGHNPPFLLSTKTKQVLLLEKGGMALGVMDEIVLLGRRLVLSPGDCLILYTDGITEAFSPENEIFGDERLRSILEKKFPAYLRRRANTNLKNIVEAIDVALQDFTGGAPLSDDQTLVVLRRH